MQIRIVTKDDAAQIIELLRAFNEEGLDGYGFGWDEDSLKQTTEYFITNALCLAAQEEGKVVGVTAGIVVPYFLNHKMKLFQQFVFYVFPIYRGRNYGSQLLKALEDTCRKLDVDKMVVANTSKIMDEKFKRFYIRKGYELLETHYIKGIR